VGVSKWTLVTSGVPRGSVLGPVLFTIYINDLDDGILKKLLKFADDTKILGKVATAGQIRELQDDLDRLLEWSDKWQMEFNAEKCKVMHVGYSNTKANYIMNNVTLTKVTEEKDLGVIITSDLKSANQSTTAAKKGNQILGLIYRTFSSKKKEIIVPLYKALVRPHLDFCMQAWNPHYKKDIEALEKVQRRATRMITECKGKDYEERLAITGLTTLETRRLRADLAQVYRILNKIDNIDESVYFERNATRGASTTRGNAFKLYKKGFHSDMAKYSFGNRVVLEWNRLPNSVVLSRSVDVFKGRLDDYLGRIRGLR
jgi:ribonuclease P/MRP protein subunit RPP40